MNRPIALWSVLIGVLASDLGACKRDEAKVSASPAPAISAQRTLDHQYGDEIPLGSLREGDVLRYPSFSLTYRGLRSKPGEPTVLARYVFSTTNKSGKQVELAVVQGTTAAMQIAGVMYRIETRGGVLKIANL